MPALFPRVGFLGVDDVAHGVRGGQEEEEEEGESEEVCVGVHFHVCWRGKFCGYRVCVRFKAERFEVCVSKGLGICVVCRM